MGVVTSIARTCPAVTSGRVHVLAVALGCVVAAGACAGEETLFSARDGAVLATEAARAWAVDAELIYLENDEPVDGAGVAERWGFLFRSESAGELRAYSVRDGKIEVAEKLNMDFEAPAVSREWIDSTQALAAAEEKVGARYRTEAQGHLEAMLLMRGVFHDEQPNATTWTVVYSAAGVPSLFVVVDAATGKVARTWRG
jgi:hypothetical protein